MYNEELIKHAIEKNPFYKKDKNKCITLQDKLVWLNVNNLTELKIQCADKLGVKQYAAETLGFNICPETYAVYNSFEDIDLSKLPDKFILKMNNGCAKNIYCFNKSKFDLNKYKGEINKWFKLTSGLTSIEYQYTGQKPQLFAEELLINKSTESLIDYRFWCMNNEVQLISVNSEHGWGALMYFDKDFNVVDLINKSHTTKNLSFKKPQNFDKMLEIVNKLSRPFKFVRIDMYNINGKLYLGEMTFSPGGYNFHFTDSNGNNKDEYYGGLLTI